MLAKGFKKVLTRDQINVLRRMERLLLKELEKRKSGRKREIISLGLRELDKALTHIEKRTQHPSSKISVRTRVLRILAGSDEMSQSELLEKLRELAPRAYGDKPNFSQYFVNVMRRLRAKPPRWLHIERGKTKWYYCDSRAERSGKFLDDDYGRF